MHDTNRPTFMLDYSKESPIVLFSLEVRMHMIGLTCQVSMPLLTSKRARHICATVQYIQGFKIYLGKSNCFILICCGWCTSKSKKWHFCHFNELRPNSSSCIFPTQLFVRFSQMCFLNVGKCPLSYLYDLGQKHHYQPSLDFTMLGYSWKPSVDSYSKVAKLVHSE